MLPPLLPLSVLPLELSPLELSLAVESSGNSSSLLSLLALELSPTPPLILESELLSELLSEELSVLPDESSELESDEEEESGVEE